MFNKQQILDKLNSLGFPRDQYCIMTGAALVLYGIRHETADIDIGCSSLLFDQLLQKGYEAEQRKIHKGIVIDGCVEIFEGWTSDKILFIEGIPVADIHYIRQFKEQLGREKDLRDIKLIDSFLEKKSEL